ncbi:Multiple C2 and transmembrane domain-containing protein 1 [Bagarius yarrelli]|uniref:Multiple C2 and transmembrane domain-containing protein 1 n=1 Tax=Bagarius yarrelli TaxID=175774 RepID=A0A556U5K5_BAGYA|nr:Multiple C2 and transmembrane domain-containing protein 1 [Bagarius yarrelli]
MAQEMDKHLAKIDKAAIGTSDPYVKFKIAGKEVFRSRTIHKNLNPVWDEKVTLLVDNIREPLYVKVFDYDFGLQDDFMGSAYLHLESLEQHRTLDVSLNLKDPHYPDHDLGSLELAVTLTPKDGDFREATIHKSLNPQWREQFDFHLYDEEGGFIDITVWDRDAGKKDDFMGRCQVDLSLLSKECTHKLELPLEEGEGMLVLLATLTASAAVSISDLSVNMLDDPRVRREILHRYTHTVYKNLNPEWNKVFTFNVKDIHSVLEVTVYDEDRDRSADFLGKVAIPLLSIQNGERKAYALKSKELTGPTKGVIFLEIDVIYNAVKAGLRTLIPIEQKYIEEEPRVSKQECTHKLELPLGREGEGMLVLLVTLTASAAVSISDLSVNMLDSTPPRSVRREILHRYRKETMVRGRAGLQTLFTVYITIKSDGHNELKYLNARNVKDIHSVLEVTVYDEDRDRSADFLGKVAIPLLSIQNGERKAYALKSKELTGPTKGVIFLEIDVIYNAVKAGLRTLIPIEQKYIEEEPRVSKQLFIVVVWNFELYMIPLALLLLLAWNYVLIASGKDNRQGDMQAVEDLLEGEDEDFDRDDKVIITHGDIRFAVGSRFIVR